MDLRYLFMNVLFPPLNSDKEVNSCPANQVFRYNLTTCQQSCRSLSDGNKYCLEGFTPVDGCGCPENSYVNEKGICVPMADCSCHHKGLYVQPGDSIMKDDKRWYVVKTESSVPV